jgi:hypothetical protein
VMTQLSGAFSRAVLESLEGAQHSGDELFFGESQKLGDFFSECENKQPELRNIFYRVDVSVQFASWLYVQSRSLFNIVQLTTGRLPRRHHFVNGPTTINLKKVLTDRTSRDVGHQFNISSNIEDVEQSADS